MWLRYNLSYAGFESLPPANYPEFPEGSTVKESLSDRCRAKGKRRKREDNQG